MNILDWINVTKSYGSADAVSRLTLGVGKGKILGLLGPNGAGKSTMMELACGTLSPSSGSVTILGGDPRRADVRANLGVMPQNVAAPEDLTGIELIRLWAAAYPNPMPLDEVVQRSNLNSIANTRFGQLSGGQVRRVGFALAICGRPSLLLLDEPSAGLDVDARRALWNNVHELAQQGAPVVVSSHYLEEVEALADQVALMARGKLLFHGPIGEIKRAVAYKIVRFKGQVSKQVVLSCHGVLSYTHDERQHVVHTENPALFLRDLLPRSTLMDLEVTDVTLESAIEFFLAKEIGKQQ